VWGRIRSKKAAAKAESYALEADYEFARQSLAAAVARAYITTIEAAQQEANAQETLDIYQEYSKLTDVRKEQGFASDFDVSQIKSRTAIAGDALYAAQAARAQTIRAIEVVTSRYPAGRFDVRRSFPGQPRAVPAGLPAQILERRPDLIASERRFAACFSSGERGAHRAVAALCAQRHQRARKRGTRRSRHSRCPRLEFGRWDYATDFLWR
jgi:outer membrane protein TolC